MKHSKEYLFGGFREATIQRDGEKCVNCGMTRVEHREKYGFDITVDHIDGRGRYTPKEQKNNSMDNLQTLCAGCHNSKDGKRGLASRWDRSKMPIFLRIGRNSSGMSIALYEKLGRPPRIDLDFDEDNRAIRVKPGDAIALCPHKGSAQFSARPLAHMAGRYYLKEETKEGIICVEEDKINE